MKIIESKKHSLLQALAIVLLIALTSCATNNQLPKDHFASEKLTSEEYAKLGDLCLSRGDSINAFVNYEKCLRMDPDNTRVHYMKGLLFLTEEQYPDAEESFLKVLKKEPDHARAHQGLGQVSLQMKHYDKAEEYFRKAIELDPTLWNSHNLLGVNCDYKKNHPEAINHYQTALGLKPNNGSILNNMGLSYSMAGKHEEAIRVLKRALETNFDQSKIYNNLGLVYFRAGRYQEAFDALQNGGDDAQALNNLGSMYLAQGNNEKARQCFEKALVLRPHNYETANKNLHKCNVTPFDLQFFASQKGGVVSYKVKEGENLYSIARKQNMEYSDLIRLNNLSPESVIYPDQVLLVREQ